MLLNAVVFNNEEDVKLLMVKYEFIVVFKFVVCRKLGRVVLMFSISLPKVFSTDVSSVITDTTVVFNFDICFILVSN